MCCLQFQEPVWLISAQHADNVKDKATHDSHLVLARNIPLFVECLGGVETEVAEGFRCVAIIPPNLFLKPIPMRLSGKKKKNLQRQTVLQLGSVNED